MAVGGSGYLSRPAPSGLADVVETVLDKGIVIDAYARVSLVGIELLTLDARVVVASVDTYLRFAEATNRMDLAENGPKTMPELAQERFGQVVEHVASDVVEGKIESGLEKIEEKAEQIGPLAEVAVKGAEKVVAKVVEAVVPDEDDAGA